MTKRKGANYIARPAKYWVYSKSTGHPVCYSCRKGYGSKLDGVCSICRGVTAYEFHKANT